MDSNAGQRGNGKWTMRRRVKSAALVLISQMLLVALAFAWVVHMAIIAAYGSISFVEDDPIVLWAEIIVSGLIMVFAVYVLVIQIIRLGEKRSTDRSPAPSPANKIGEPGRAAGVAYSTAETQQSHANLNETGNNLTN